ncbi:MAG TPA: DUF4143 domain-containing protein [Actinophytocola sp.]|uniref:ATP-binding protein n=1 Tax=Actinophytocola sp. TaxID=1872138 RepID=UPI002E016C9D|nr:DUF4143 domain-containing protein [Actinophytocola sp.]
MFAQGADLRTEPLGLRRRDYLDRAARGGYPEAMHRDTPRRRQRFFDSYLIVRDVKQVADIEHAADMRRLLSLLAAQTSGLLSVNRLAGELSITAPTVRNYIEILETVFVVRRLPAWSAGTTTRTVGMPKVIFIDPGLAHTPTASATSDAPIGALIGNFVLSEIARQLTWSTVSARLYHYRDQYEVDGVLEDNTGNIVGIEIKAAETVRSNDFRGLRLLQRRLGPRFHAGLVLYCGSESLSFGDNLACLPISALWTTPT